MKEMKKELRKHYKALRLSMKNKEQKDKCISENLINTDLYKNANTVLLYVSSEIEVSTYSIIADAFSQKKTVAVPRCNPVDCTMEFYIISSFEDLSEGAYGIYEPLENCKMVECDNMSVCIVPGLSFDKDGYRLGFGKGYYDRYLSAFPGKSIGLCYDECFCEKTVRDKFDKAVSVIVTETEIYNINNT